MSFIQVFGDHRLHALERLLWVILLHAIPSERQLMERLELDLLFRSLIASEFMDWYEIIPSSLRIIIMGAVLAGYEHGTRWKYKTKFPRSILRPQMILR